MTEKLSQPERRQSGEGSAEHRSTAEAHQSQAEHGRQEKKPDLEQIRHQTEAEALSSEQIKTASGQTKNHKPKEEFVGSEAKELTYQRTLLKVRRHLSPLGRATSKVIHQRAVEAVSEAAGKTVARPSGLLGGGLVAFVGTSAYYYMTRHYGYDYRYSVFLALLVGGFIAGWLAESIFKTFRHPK